MLVSSTRLVHSLLQVIRSLPKNDHKDLDVTPEFVAKVKSRIKSI